MRKTKLVTLLDGGQNLTFEITQMPATKLEKWINRLVLLLARGGKEAFQIPEGAGLEGRVLEAIRKQGMEGILKLVGSMDYDDVEPLYEELLSCCSRVLENYKQPCTRETIDGYIAEVKTLYMLRLEALKVNFDFFLIAGNSLADQEMNSEADIRFTKVTQM